MAETLYEKALRLLGRPVAKAADPDDPDSRISEEAQPTDKKLEEAGEEAAAGGQAGGAPGGDTNGVPADPGAESGEGPGPDGSAEHEGGESPDQEASEQKGGDDDGEDMSDDEVRELRKAFGLTTEDDIDQIKKGKEIAGMLGQILAHVKNADAYMANLTKELAELKASHRSGAADADLRPAMKSMDEKIDTLQALLENLPRTAPAAAQPKGFQKAIPSVEPERSRLTMNDVTTLAMKGEITALEAARLTRQINHTPNPA